MQANQTQVFLSRVIGLPLVDADGDQVGRIKDFVFQLQQERRAPRVLGAVVDLASRQRIFLPMARIQSVSVTNVAIKGQVDVRRFVKRPHELLVDADMFDRSVERDIPTRIRDVSMIQTRNREWELHKVALRQRSGVSRFGFGGRSQTEIVDWREVPDLVLGAGRTAAHLVAEFADMKPADVAQELHDMDPSRLAEVVGALDDETLAEALEELPEDEQVALISTLEVERAADVLEEMDPDDAADLIRGLPATMAEDLLRRMEPEEASDVRRLMTYEQDTAGGMMTPEPVIVGPDATVADALARCRQEQLTPALASMVFVCRPPLDTPSGPYIGAVHVQRLLRGAPTLPVAGMLDHNLEPLSPTSPLASVSRFFATYNLVVAPVVGGAGQLVGAVTVDDVLDHMLPADWRGDQMEGISVEEGDDGTQ